MDKEQQGIPVVCDRREERIVNSGDRDIEMLLRMAFLCLGASMKALMAMGR